MKNMLYVGIDPGSNGSLVILGRELLWYKTEEPLELVDTVLPIIRDSHSYCLIENVHSMPGQGVTSMFSFGRNFGKLEMFLQATGSAWDCVQPAIWQSHFNLLKREGETKTEKKNRHKKRAQVLFPEIKVTHRNADGLLIAEYCRRMHT